MEPCEDYVLGHSDNAIEVISSSILLGKGDILELIETLGVYLTSTNIETRCSATKLLSAVLGSPSVVQFLPPDDIHYLVQFYCDRLKDYAVVLPQIISGLHVLVMGRNIKEEGALLIFRSVFKEVHCQSLQFEERHDVFAIFLSLLTHQLHALSEHSEEFVLGYIQVLDGERDPRNLLLAFSSVLIIINSLQYDMLVDDLFEVISCYFPIDFSPPPNDPLAVSRDTLVQSLRQCLSATPKFAKTCLPLLMEKLSSDVLTAKLDSLYTLVTAAPVYGPVAMEPFLEQLWTAIEREMFKSASVDVQLGCVSAMRAIAVSLSQPLNNTQLHQFISIVLQDCQHYLKEPELKLMEPVVQLLCGVSMASDPAAVCVLPQVLPILLDQYFLTEQVSHKRALLDGIQCFIKAGTSAQMEASSPLIVCKESLIGVLQSALNQPDTACKNLAISIFSSLLLAPGLLVDSEVINYSLHLKTMAVSSSCENMQDIRGPTSSALQAVCKIYPILAKKHLINPLLGKVTSDPSEAWLLVVLASTPTLVASVLPTLVAVLQDTLANFSYHEETSLPGVHWEQVSSISSALLDMIKRNAESGPLTLASVDCLLQLSHQAANRHWNCCNAKVSKFIECIAFSLSHNARYATDRWCGDSIQLVLNTLMGPSMTLSSDPPACLCLPHLEALIGAAPPTIVAHWSKQLCDPLLKLSLIHSTSKHAVTTYASILNKQPDGPELTGWIENHMDSLWSDISSLESCGGSFIGPLTVWIWMTKALTMRAHKMGLVASHKLLGLCTGNDQIGALAADGFRLILSDCKTILNIPCHANVKLFYKQHLFVSILPELMQKILKVEECRKRHLLRLLAHFLIGVPQQVILGELSKVLPLLLECLGSKDTDVKVSTLSGVLSILTVTPHSFSGYVTILLPCLLSLSSDQSSMVIRRTSLQCLEALFSLPTHLIYPHQRQVLTGLASALDDHKRLVRRAAVDARAKWFLL